MFVVALAVLAVALLAGMGKGGARAPAPAPAPRQTPGAVVPPPAPSAPGQTTVVVVPPGNETHDGGVVTPPDPPEPPRGQEIDPRDIPPELLPIVQQAGSASEQDLERGVALANELGFPDIADHLQFRLDRRRSYAAAQRGGEAPAAPRSVPVQTSVQTAGFPVAQAPRQDLASLALRVADSIRRSSRRQYDRALLTQFQRAAGLAADGLYGPRSRQALGHYGRIPDGQLPAAQF